MNAPSKIAPTGNRVWIEPTDLIVSKTTVESYITYANEGFCNISGYTEEELLGAPQNIVRHPAMPKAVFELMWQHLKQEQEFFGYVLNLAKDGSEYWTFAHVTPFYQGEDIQGFISVRRAVNENTIEFIEAIYQDMLKIEENNPQKEVAMAQSSTRLWKEINKEYQSYAEFILSL